MGNNVRRKKRDNFYRKEKGETLHNHKGLKKRIEEFLEEAGNYKKEDGFKWEEHPVIEIGDLKIY